MTETLSHPRGPFMYNPVFLVAAGIIKEAEPPRAYRGTGTEDDLHNRCKIMQMSSDGPNHNEFDFEFLGNTTGEPYLVQTNVYVNGVGNREQRLNLWFDPTKDFHSYSILWNQHQVV